MIINGIYHQQQQVLNAENNSSIGNRNVQMEDLNNNLNSSMNRKQCFFLILFNYFLNFFFHSGFLTNGQNETSKTDLEYSSVKLKSEKNEINQISSLAPKCANCLLPIEDKFICNMMNMYWHEECLTCSQCFCMLNQSCFFKNGLLFCKDDYFK